MVALPEQEEWTIMTETGTTTANAMSSFSMETEDGRELSFVKDNCPMEEGALAGDSGDQGGGDVRGLPGDEFPGGDQGGAVRAGVYLQPLRRRAEAVFVKTLAKRQFTLYNRIVNK